MMRISPEKLLLILVVATACTARAQLRAGASIGLVAKLPGSVTLTERMVPVSWMVRNGSQTTVMVPLEVSWNLDPRETQSFRVLARFVGEGELLASAVQARMEGGEFRDFPMKNGQSVLFNVAISARNRQGREQRMMELKIDNAVAASLADGVYRGRLSLEVRRE
jgi:hypothetical protein